MGRYIETNYLFIKSLIQKKITRQLHSIEDIEKLLGRALKNIDDLREEVVFFLIDARGTYRENIENFLRVFADLCADEYFFCRIVLSESMFSERTELFKLFELTNVDFAVDSFDIEACQRQMIFIDLHNLRSVIDTKI